MFLPALSFFEEIEEVWLQQDKHALKLEIGWGQLYGIEQLMEYVILHLLIPQLQIKN